MLGVDGHVVAGQARQVDAGAFAVDGELDGVVDVGFAVHAVPDAGLAHEAHGALLEDAGADGLLDLLAGAGLEDHGFDAVVVVQEVREGQTGGAGADDGYWSVGHVNCP